MKNEFQLDHSKMYRLPYSKNDNPNGWIEITTHCNMKCPGCYKGIDREETPVFHEPPDNIKKDILELKRIRNCKIITISGGEALMHPNIEEIVQFIKSNNLHSFIHTNGILLTDDNIQRMKKSGLTGFIVRIDTLNRPEYTHEEDLDFLRSQIAEKVFKTGGLQLGFTSVVDQSNLLEINHVVSWFQKNNKYCDYQVLILKREYDFDHSQIVENQNEVSIHDVAVELHQHFPKMEFSSYLGDQNYNIGFKWLHVGMISFNGKVLGYVDAKLIELSTILQHFKYGNYSYVSHNGRNKLTVGNMIMGSFLSKRMRKIAKAYLKIWIKTPGLWFKVPNTQVINFVNPPSLKKGMDGFCDACPDAVLYEGLLQPSCILESIKQSQKKEQL
jgi:hypothetical protein